MQTKAVPKGGKASPVRLVHPFPPLYNENSRILILGSFPSVRSREQRFYYGHPQNRFWRLLAALFAEDVPGTIEEKKTFILSHRLALWDSIGSCTIIGSSDSSIRDVRPNDLSSLLQRAPIQKIFCNGSTSFHLYEKHLFPQTGLPAGCLPSTSPANARWTLPMLMEAWHVIII